MKFYCISKLIKSCNLSVEYEINLFLDEESYMFCSIKVNFIKHGIQYSNIR